MRLSTLRRKSLLTVTVAALVGLAAYLTVGGLPAGDDIPARRDSIESHGHTIAPPSAPLLATDSHRTESVAIGPTDEHPPATLPSLVTIDGTVSIEGVAIDDLEILTGNFRAEIQGLDGLPRAERVAVQRGRWSMQARPGEIVVVSDLVLSRRVARIRGGSFAASAQGHEEIRADWAFSGRLRVVDRLSNADLQNVTLVLADGYESASKPYPPDRLAARPLVSSVDSPFPMPDSPGVNQYWVGAPGYAWRRISIGELVNERIVALDAGGEVEFLFDGVRHHDGIHVMQLRAMSLSSGANADSVYSLTGDSLLLSGVREGSYQARVVFRPSTGSERELASCDFDVVPRTKTRVPLALSGTYNFPSGRLHGELLLAEESWPNDLQLLAFSLDSPRDQDSCHRVQRKAMLQVDAGRLAWSVNGLAPGPYRLLLDPYGVSTTAIVLNEQDCEVKMDLLGLAVLRVWPTTADGLPVRAARLTWRVYGRTDKSCWKSAVVSSEPAFLRSTCAPGPVELVCRADGFRTVRWIANLDAGPNDLAVTMAPAGRYEIEIELRHGDEESPVPPTFWSGIKINGSDWPDELLERSLSGVGDGRGTSLDVARAALVMSSPGRYLLEFPKVDGFAEIVSTSVEFQAGATRVVVHLQLREF